MGAEVLIKASIHSDDYKIEVDFDAAKWFTQASDRDIRDLCDSDWGGDYAADVVGEYMAEHNDDVAKVFAYLELVNDQGFEVRVDEDSTVAWLKEHRPTLNLAGEPTDETMNRNKTNQPSYAASAWAKAEALRDPRIPTTVLDWLARGYDSGWDMGFRHASDGLKELGAECDELRTKVDAILQVADYCERLATTEKDADDPARVRGAQYAYAQVVALLIGAIAGGQEPQPESESGS